MKKLILIGICILFALTTVRAADCRHGISITECKTLEDDYVKILITDLYETDSGQDGAPNSWVDFQWIWT